MLIFNLAQESGVENDELQGEIADLLLMIDIYEARVAQDEATQTGGLKMVVLIVAIVFGASFGLYSFTRKKEVENFVRASSGDHDD